MIITVLKNKNQMRRYEILGTWITKYEMTTWCMTTRVRPTGIEKVQYEKKTLSNDGVFVVQCKVCVTTGISYSCQGLECARPSFLGMKLFFSNVISCTYTPPSCNNIDVCRPRLARRKKKPNIKTTWILNVVHTKFCLKNMYVI